MTTQSGAPVPDSPWPTGRQRKGCERWTRIPSWQRGRSVQQLFLCCLLPCVAAHSELRPLVWTMWVWCQHDCSAPCRLGCDGLPAGVSRCAESLSSAEVQMLMQAGPGLKGQTRSLPKRQAGVYLSSAAEPEEGGQPREVATAPQVGLPP